MADLDNQHASMYGEAHAPSSQHGPYESYTPVSLSGCSSPAGSQRLGSVDYTASGSFSMPLDMTPPHSATLPFFPMNMPAASAAGPMQQSLASAAAAAAAVDPLSYGMSSSSFPSQPTTPERNHSFSSQESYGSPTSPVGHMLPPSYPASIASVSSVASLASLAGPPTPEGYPFPDVQNGSGSSNSNSSSSNNNNNSSSSSSNNKHSKGAAGQQPLPSPYHQPQLSPSSYHYPAASPFEHDSSEYSPSRFYWQSQNRPESPAINYFGDRPSLPPPPPSVTLRSSVIKGAESDAGYGSPAGPDSVYGSPASRRALSYSGAQVSAKALQDAVASQSSQSPPGSSCSSSSSSHSSHHQQHHHHAHHHHHQQQQQHAHHAHHMHGYAMASLGMVRSADMDGTRVRRNGIEIARIASGAYKCVVPGCPSRPFKRSEHLKRHVTTHHENKDQYSCNFCSRQFNRKDNWRSHLKLHTAPRGKNARTEFYPAAVALFNEEMRKVTKSRARKEMADACMR